MVSSSKELDIRRESVVSALANVVIIVAQLTVLGVLTRALGSGDVGAYFFALAAALIAIIPSRELSEVMRKRVSEVGTPNSEFLGLAQVGTGAYLVCFTGIVLLAKPLLTAWTPMVGATVLAFIVYTVALTQSAMSTRLWDAVGSPGKSVIAQAIRDLVFLGTVVGLAGSGRATPATVLLARAGVHLVFSVGIYAVIGLVPRLPTRETVRHGFEYGKWVFPIGIAGHIWAQAPTILLGTLLGGSAVALYEAVKRLTMAGPRLATCITNPLFVKTSGLESTGESVVEYIRVAVDYTPSVAIPSLFILAPVASEVLILGAGPTYGTGTLALVGIAAFHVISGIRTPMVAGLLGVDHPRYVCYLSVATLCLGIPGLVAGASIAGLEGVIAVLISLEIANVVAAQFAIRETLGEYIVPTTLHVQVGAASVAGALVWAGTHVVDASGGVGLVTLLTGGILVHYGLFGLVSRGFRSGAIRTVKDAKRAVLAMAPA